MVRWKVMNSSLISYELFVIHSKGKGVIEQEGDGREQFWDLHQIDPQAPLLLVSLSQKWSKQNQFTFSHHFDHYHLLDIITPWYHMQFQHNRMISSWENGSKPHFRPILDIWDLLGLKFFPRKSGFVTFVHSMDSNLMQKCPENLWLELLALLWLTDGTDFRGHRVCPETVCI